MNNHSMNVMLASSLMVITTMLLQSCTDGKSETNAIPKGSAPIPVKVIQLQKTSATSVITASGQLTTEDETILGFKTGGVVSGVFVKEGDQIKKGQLLAKLDLTEINALVAQARFGYEKAQRDFQRITNLFRDSVATLEQMQNVETSLAVAKEQLDAATFNRSFSEIHAAANGYVLRKFVNTGQVVSTGDPILLTNAAAQGKWILKIGVSDKQWAAIQVKDRASVRIDAIPERTFQASVSRKSETSDPLTGTFAVELLLKNEGVKLATGMFGSASLQSDEPVSSWSVPYEAVLDANGDEGFVFTTSDTKIAHKQPVTIESFNGTTMRISSGLEAGGLLIISGSAYLSDHSPILIVK
jgi:RND family efflux transporter MFP subunit